MLLIITFLLIFGWKINSWFDISAFTALILILSSLFFWKKTSKQIFPRIPVFSLILLLIYSFIIVSLTNFSDLQPILRSGRALSILFSAIFLFEIYKNKYTNPILKICQHIYISLAIHAIIMISMYCSSEIQNYIYSITHAFDIINNSIVVIRGDRVCGLTYGLSQTSILQLFGLILLPFIYKNTGNKLTRFLYMFSAIFIFLSIFLAGRTGLFLLLFYFPIFIYYEFKNSKSSLKSYFVSNLRNGIITIIVAVLIAIATTFLLPKKFINNTLFYSQEIFKVFINQSHTLDELKEMYFLPESLSKLIWGCGNYGRTETFYLPSDVGWIKSIFAIGIIGTAFMIIPYIWAIYAACKPKKESYILSFIIILIFISTLLLNFKELSLLTRNQWTIQAILLVILNSKLQENNKNITILS